MHPRHDGTRDVQRATERLARRLPEPLEDLAWIAYNYLWSWTPAGEDLFRLIDNHRFNLSGSNPVRFLANLPERDLLRAATSREVLDLLDIVRSRMEAELARPTKPASQNGTVAYLCAEFGVHPSMPVYSGGLGILAGDYLKETSDQALDVVGVGLLYRRGYLHQRMDTSGWQHEYWVEANTGQIPAVRVRGENNLPIKVRVPIWDGELVAHVWRVNVGRTPLYLLDAELEENSPLERWVTARLYEGSHDIRLAQYALLGVGGVKALQAMGIEPGLFHLNEGHPALSALEIARQTAATSAGAGKGLGDLLAMNRERFAFTTHTPVPAGNETYSPEEFFSVLGATVDAMGFSREELSSLARVDQTSTTEPVGFSPLALRFAGRTNAVAKRHGEVAREMWQPLYPDTDVADVPITHVTNGVHLPTWMSPSMRGMLSSVFGQNWERYAHDQAMWNKIDEISDADLWAARCQMRTELITMIRNKSVVDRLARGESVHYAESALEAFDPEQLTLGFARRLATYKRLGLLFHDTNRLRSIIDRAEGAQIVIAGKAHPLDNEAKGVAQNVFRMRKELDLNSVIFAEDYDMRIAPSLVSGCDVWLNLPRPPMEASGTSGMKSAMNGGLNLSVLDGWWVEGYNGSNGWAIDGSTLDNPFDQDNRDATQLYDILEHEVLPLFYQRNAEGIPTAWLARVRSSLRSCAPMFSSARMVADYQRKMYN